MMERGRFEGPQQPVRWRTKGGLETPLRGRFAGEMKRLTFAPPVWYDVLVLLCLAFGVYCGLGVAGLASFQLFDVQASGVALIILAVGVTLAGIWGLLSNERMSCDLRARTYTRLEGQAFAKRVTRGSLNELYGLVLMTQDTMMPGFVGGGRTVVYRLVLYWKGSKEPLLVVDRVSGSIPANVPLNAGAGAIAQRGYRYAQALGVPYYDYSHVNSPGPLPVV
jgi:hypothetical protein